MRSTRSPARRGPTPPRPPRRALVADVRLRRPARGAHPPRAARRPPATRAPRSPASSSVPASTARVTRSRRRSRRSRAAAPPTCARWTRRGGASSAARGAALRLLVGAAVAARRANRRPPGRSNERRQISLLPSHNTTHGVGQDTLWIWHMTRASDRPRREPRACVRTHDVLSRAADRDQEGCGEEEVVGASRMGSRISIISIRRVHRHHLIHHVMSSSGDVDRGGGSCRGRLRH